MRGWRGWSGWAWAVLPETDGILGLKGRNIIAQAIGLGNRRPLFRGLKGRNKWHHRRPVVAPFQGLMRGLPPDPGRWPGL